MPYKTIKNRLVNEVTLGDGYPLSNNLQALKVGGETSPLEMSTHLPDESDKAKVKVVGDLEVTGSILKQPTLHILNGGAYNTGTTKFYLPLVGSNRELTSPSSNNESIAFSLSPEESLKRDSIGTVMHNPKINVKTSGERDR